jgi:hypothetical protein
MQPLRGFGEMKFFSHGYETFQLADTRAIHTEKVSN